MGSFSAFCASLDCPLTNVRWSWSARSKDGRRAVITIWDDEVEGDRYPLWSPRDTHINDRPGAKELRRISGDVIKSGREVLGIRCFARDIGAEPRQRDR